MVQNQRFSLNGWSFRTWAIKNKDSIKLLVSAAVGLSAGYASNLPPTQATFMTAVTGVISKLVLDTLDYWQSQ
jgi:uncharacterized membrane protein YeiH